MRDLTDEQLYGIENMLRTIADFFLFLDTAQASGVESISVSKIYFAL